MESKRKKLEERLREIHEQGKLLSEERRGVEKEINHIRDQERIKAAALLLHKHVDFSQEHYVECMFVESVDEDGYLHGYGFTWFEFTADDKTESMHLESNKWSYNAVEAVIIDNEKYETELQRALTSLRTSRE